MPTRTFSPADFSFSGFGRLLMLGAALSLAAARPVSASVVAPMPFATLVGDASAIFRGEVIDVRSEWRQLRDERVIVTVVLFKVERVLKGTASATLALETLGGTIGDTSMVIPGMPQFVVGDRDVLCIERAQAALFPVLGATQGRFRILTDRAGSQRVVFNDGRPVGAVTQIGRAAVLVSSSPIAPLGLSAFESTIEQEVARGRR